jgi:hypothetical protein
MPSAAASGVDLTNQGAPAASAPAASGPVAVAVPDAAASTGPAVRYPAYDASGSGAGSASGPEAVASSTGSAALNGADDGATLAARSAAPATSPFLLLAVGLLVAGFALVAGRFLARRLT